MIVKITGRVMAVSSVVTDKQYVVGKLSIGKMNIATEPTPYTTEDERDAAIAATMMDLLMFAERALSEGASYA